MSLKEQVQKELSDFRNHAADAELRMRLAKSEANSELRIAWMQAEQNAAKLEVRLATLAEETDAATSKLVQQLKDAFARVKKSLND